MNFWNISLGCFSVNEIIWNLKCFCFDILLTQTLEICIMNVWYICIISALEKLSIIIWQDYTGEHAVLMLVGNKIDANHKRATAYADGERLAEVCELWNCYTFDYILDAHLLSLYFAIQMLPYFRGGVE